MEENAFLNDDCAVLWHWDFAPQNMLAARTADNAWTITALADWDGFLPVPRVVARKPPT